MGGNIALRIGGNRSRNSVQASTRRACRASVAVLAASAACAQWARAATDSWTLAGSGNWATGSNWSAGVPAAGNTVNITADDNTTRDIAYNYTGAAITLGALTVDNDGPEGITTISMTGSGTALTAANEYFGASNTSTLPGYGAMIQSVGTNSLTPGGSLVLGNGAQDTGIYDLSGTGTVITGLELIGVNGAGTFSQSGGTNSITNSGEIEVGTNSGSTGNYTLTAGTLACDGSELLDATGTAVGIFTQSGGVNNVPALDVGYGTAGGNGTYSLSASGAINSESEIVGVSGPGTFIQSGGANNISGDGQAFYLGYYVDGAGTYSLSAGTLTSSTGSEYVGYGGAGTLIISGGTDSVTGDVYVGDSTNGGQGTVTVSGGLLSMSGDLVASNSALDTVSLSSGTISLAGMKLGGNPSLFSWTGGTLIFTDAVTVDSSFALGATLILTSGLTFSADATLNDNGVITTSAGANLSAALLNVGGILTDSGGTISYTVLTVEEGGSVNVNAALTNSTSIAVATGGEVELNGGTLTNNGVIQVQTGDLISGTGSISNGASGIITGAGNIAASVTNSGTIQPNGGLMTFTGPVTNTGTISAPIGGEALLEDMPTNAGTLSLNGGTISTNSATLKNTGQILGYGILSTGGLTNDGTIEFAGQSSVYGPVTNDAAGLIHLSGNTLNVFYGAVTNRGSFVVDAGASGSIYGAYTGSGSILDNGSLYLNANSVAGPISGSGFLTIGSTSSGPAIVQLNASSGLSTQDELSINTGSTFDITNNHFIINYGSGPDPIASIAAWIESGYNGGAWNGPGIISSTAAVTPGCGLGYADSADPGNPAGLSSGTIEIKYTLLGDANLDGVVNAVDFGILAANFNKGVTGWDQGDFNYDNVVNAVDFGELAANFNKGASGASFGPSALSDPAVVAFAQANGLMAEVPEPSMMALFASAACAVLLRRRRGR